MIPHNFTHKSQEAMQRASVVANENGQPQVEPPHVFSALLEQEDGVVVSVLKKLNVNLAQLRHDVQRLISGMPKQTGALPGGIGQILMGQAMMYILQNAAQESQKMGDEYISVEHLLLAFLTNRNPISQALGEQGAQDDDVLKILAKVRGTQRVDSPAPEVTYQ